MRISLNVNLEILPIAKDGIVMILDDIVTKREKEKLAAE
jgi:hypothetical protein